MPIDGRMVQKRGQAVPQLCAAIPLGVHARQRGARSVR